MALQVRLDAFKADFVSGRWLRQPTQEVLDTMSRGTAELIATGQAQRASRAGERCAGIHPQQSRRQAGVLA